MNLENREQKFARNILNVAGELFIDINLQAQKMPPIKDEGNLMFSQRN